MSTDVLLQSMSMPSSLDLPLPKFQKLDDRYRCVICHEVLRVPMMTHCGCRMCRSCITRHLERFDGGPVKCPSGFEDCVDITLQTLSPDFGTHREIQKLIVFCSNNEYGCPDLMPWAKLQEHEARCTYSMEDCVNKGFGCKTKVIKSKMQQHLDKECKFRTEHCPHCEVRILLSMLESHIQNSCPSVSIICPYKCGEQSIPRGEIDDHRKVCQAKPKDCKYRACGCNFTGTVEEVRQHEASSVSHHLDIMFNDVRDLKKENSELKKIIEERQTNTAHVGVTADLNILTKVPVIEKRQEYQETMLKSIQKNHAEIKGTVQQKADRTEFNSVKESVKSVERRLDGIKQNAPSNLSDEAKTQLVQMERTLGLSNMRLQEMDLRLQCVETASYNGVLIWKIRDFRRRKSEAVSARTVSLYSQPFYTSRYGYKACARIYLNGDGMGKGTHVSLFFVILRGDFDALLHWPFRQKVTMTLLDQDGGKKNIVDSFRADPTSNSFKRPTTDMNIASGCPLFAPQSTVESSTFLKDDCIFLKIYVDTNELKDASYDAKSGL